jgi:hypothetical protein
MSDWLGVILDTILIGVVCAGTVQAVRLIRQLRDLRAGRAEMERFVRDFNNAVTRAEAGIKSLRSAARESGDDLEKLVEKANMVRDELTFLVESADGVADRLSTMASKAIRPEPPKPQSAETRGAEKPAPATPQEQRQPRKPSFGVSAPSQVERASISRAEQELIQALKKLG